MKYKIHLKDPGPLVQDDTYSLLDFRELLRCSYTSPKDEIAHILERTVQLAIGASFEHKNMHITRVA